MRCVRIALMGLAIAVLAAWGFLYTHYRVPILMYHALDKARVNDYASVDPAVFAQQMKFIKDRGYKVIALSEYCRLLQNRQPIAHNLVVITFDDGMRDNREAFQTLKDLDFPATIFLIVDKVDTPGYLSQEDIALFLKHSRVTIGSHGLSHAYFPEIKSDALAHEIAGSKDALQKRGVPVETMSYPAGGFDERVLREVKAAGYLCACTTNRGFSRDLNRFALRRIKITNRDKGISLSLKLSGFYDMFKRVRKPF